MTISTSPLSDHYSICAQISLEDINDIAALGFKSIVNYRPDHEGGPDQVSSQAIQEKATALGLAYQHIPVIPGNVTQENIDACTSFLASAPTPVLGFCRTGKRATMLYQAADQDN